jgi:hypothetical protein
MILPDFIIPSKVNRISVYEGLDSPMDCLREEWFDKYPFTNILYKYNNRGYRDEEWPTNLDDVIWCIGDSFTLGVGSPIEHTWPFLLRQYTGSKVINVSMNGASNEWISRKTLKLLESCKPKAIVILWSYLHRREKPREDIDDEARIWTIKDNWQSHVKNFIECRERVVRACNDTLLIDACIPNYAFESHIPIKGFLTNNYTAKFGETFLGELKQRDYARDYHHFDIKTSHAFVKQITDIMTKNNA